MNKFTYMLGIAATIALVLGVTLQPEAIEGRLVKLQTAEAYPDNERLSTQPLEVQAVMLDYRHDTLLRLKAEAGLTEVPELAHEVLVRFGAEPEFQDVLRQYGSAAFLPIYYFMHNEVRSLEWREAAVRQWQAVKAHAHEFWEEGSGNTQQSSEFDARQMGSDLTPEQRGWYAVNLVAEEGHDFLGQFTQDDRGEVKWLQSERWLEAGNNLFAGGIRQLETQWQRGQPLSYGDFGWALADGAVMVSAVKVLRMGRAGSMAVGSTTQVSRGTVLATRAGAASRLVKVGRYAKWPVVMAGSYLVIRHPALLDDGMALLAETFGYPVWLVRFLGWTILLLPCLYLGTWILRAIVPLAIRVLRSSARALMWLERRNRAERYLFR